MVNIHVGPDRPLCLCLSAHGISNSLKTLYRHQRVRCTAWMVLSMLIMIFTVYLLVAQVLAFLEKESTFQTEIRNEPFEFPAVTICKKNPFTMSDILQNPEAVALVWKHPGLRWNPRLYGNITMLHVPGDMVWRPDIILYNNADGSPQVTTITKVILFNEGTVLWEPPVIYNSMCEIDIEWFPFDEQLCRLKFGSWSYHGNAINLTFPPKTPSRAFRDADGNSAEEVERGIELSDYVESGEWDVMSAKAIRHVKTYPSCEYPFIDITYYINIKRKPLFFAINIMAPCAAISLMSITVFYLPSDSKNKMVLSMSVLISIALFFLLLTDIIPPTSTAVPLLTKYLLFTMLLVAFSIGVSVATINIHYKAGMAYPMGWRTRKVFLEFLPKFLFVTTKRTVTKSDPPKSLLLWAFDKHSPFNIRAITILLRAAVSVDNIHEFYKEKPMSESKQRAYQNACYIADKMRKEDACSRLKEDWKFVAIVIDRMVLILYLLLMASGVVYIFVSVPLLRDSRVPISQVIRAEVAAGNYSGICFK